MAHAVRMVREEEVRRRANPIKLSKETVEELEAGSTLTVRVKPVGELTREQRFSLVGFTAAARRLGSTECQKRVENRHKW